MNGGSGGAAAHSPHGSLCVALLSPVATARMRTNAGPDALANPSRVSADEGAMEKTTMVRHVVVATLRMA